MNVNPESFRNQPREGLSSVQMQKVLSLALSLLSETGLELPSLSWEISGNLGAESGVGTVGEGRDASSI